MATGQKMAICSLVRPITVRVPDGDRQVIADPVITALQGHENRPAIYRCAKIEIRQKIGEKSTDHRSIYKACDVGFSSKQPLTMDIVVYRQFMCMRVMDDHHFSEELEQVSYEVHYYNKAAGE